MRSKTKTSVLMVLVGVAGLIALARPAHARRLRLKVTGINVKKKGAKPNNGRVKRTVYRGVQKFKSCLKSAVKKKGKYQGWLWLSFDFTRSGRTRRNAVNSTLSNKFAMKCIKMYMKRWKVGKGSGGKVTTTVRIIH